MLLGSRRRAAVKEQHYNRVREVVFRVLFIVVGIYGRFALSILAFVNWSLFFVLALDAVFGTRRRSSCGS